MFVPVNLVDACFELPTTRDTNEEGELIGNAEYLDAINDAFRCASLPRTVPPACLHVACSCIMQDS